MHWTAHLARRHFWSGARVAGDVMCVSCGYNLRGLRANAKCPECAREVGDSLFVLAKPLAVAGSLAMLGLSYLTLLGFALALVPSSTGWTEIFGAMIIALGASYRVAAATRLRFYAAIHRLASLSRPLVALWIATILEAALVVLWLAGLLAYAKNLAMHTPAMARGCNWLAGSVVVLGILSLWCAGMLGAAMTSMLAYSWTRIGFIVQRLAVGAAGVAALLAALINAMPAPLELCVVAIGAAFIIATTAVIVTCVTLLQLAGAAQGETEPWDEAIARD